MSSIIREAGETFVTLVKGFSVTFRNMLRKTVTENYPEEPVHFQARYRGIHVLHRDENGLEKCVGCFLCAAARNGILGGFYLAVIRWTSRSAEKAANALLQTIFVAVQDVDPAVTRDPRLAPRRKWFGEVRDV